MTSRRRLVTRWTTVLCAATVCLAGASGYTAPWAPELREVFTGLMERLNAILQETGALDEPTWRAAMAIR